MQQNKREVIYCIDTSALVAAWGERYPPDVLPPFWDRLDRLIVTSRIFAPREVLVETEKRSDDLHAWLKERGDMFLELDDEIQMSVRYILRTYPRLVGAKKNRFAADPFVISLAKTHNFTIITEEKPSLNLNRPNIPDICGPEQVNCWSLIQFIRQEGWVFR